MSSEIWHRKSEKTCLILCCVSMWGLGFVSLGCSFDKMLRDVIGIPRPHLSHNLGKELLLHEWPRKAKSVCKCIPAICFLWRNKKIYPKIINWYSSLTLVLLNPDIPCLCKQPRSRSVGFWRSQLIWSCTVCHYVNLYQQPGSSNLFGWKLEVGMSS